MTPAALAPFRLGNVELRNRIVRTAHGTNLGRGELNEALIAYHESRARGGVALTVLEATGVHPSCPMTLNAWDDAIVPRYRELATRLHAHGMRVFSQLNHLGLDGHARGARPWSASALVAPWSGLRAVAMDATQIDALVDGFAQAARRAREGGLDGLEVHCAHGHLLQQFLSPLTNRRDDEYGGDDERRRRFVERVLRACRAAVGTDFVLGIRVGPQPTPGGLDVASQVALVRWLEAEHLVDYVSVSRGDLRRPDEIIGAMHEPAGYELADARPITAATRLPTMVAGRIRTVAEASEVVGSGIADLVGMTRAHIADPDLIAKTLAGRAHEVRPCIACNQGCVGGLARGRLGCSVNPLAGRETEFATAAPSRAETSATEARSAPARRDARPRAASPVLVAGGGPAGLEAARTLAERGVRVVLAEAGPELGGALQLARRAPRHAAIGEIADWLAREVHRLGVEVHTGTPAPPAVARELGATRVIVAVGGRAAPPLEQRHRPGADERGAKDAVPVIGARDLLRAPPARLPRRAVVLDELGTYEAIGAAEWLVEHGVAVCFVTPLRTIGPRLEAALVVGPALERLRCGTFALQARAQVLGVDAHGARLAWLEGGQPWHEPAELVVGAVTALPADDLVRAFELGSCRAIAVGDARHPGTLEEAIRSAHEIAARL
ncbi:MAG: FAD-binding protein [Pseudomonadota bacterium]